MDDHPASDSVSLDSLLTHRAFVEDLARRLAGDDSTADEVTQRTWMAAMRTPPSDERRARSWLSRVVRNLVSEKRRESGRRQRREEAVARPEAVTDAAETVVRAEAYKRLVIAVMDLAEPFRSTVLLRYFEDLPPRDVARRLGVPVETVRSRLRRSVAQLRERLDEESGGRAAWAPLFLTGWPLRGAETGVAETATTSGGLAAGGGLAVAETKTIGWVAAALVLLAVGSFAVLEQGAQDAVVPSGEAPVAAAERTAGDRSAREDPVAATPGSTAADGDPAATLPEPVDLAAVDRDRDLHGRVVDPAGAPIAGAVVSSWFRPWSESEHYFHGNDAEREGPATRTAIDGTFRVRLEPGNVVWLRVRAEGRPPRLLPARSAGERTDIVLGDGVELAITVRDSFGAKAPGFPLRVYRSHVADELIERAAVTDDSGVAVVAGLAPGLEVHVMATKDGLAPIERTRATLPESGRLAVELVIGEERRVTGRVVDAVSGEGIAGARIGWRLLFDNAITTDADGSFVVPAWDGNAGASLRARAPGYVSASAAAGSGVDVVLALQPGLLTTGRVVSSDGEPVADARVALYGVSKDSNSRQSSRAHVVTDAKGHFRADTLHAELPHTLIVEASGHARIVRALAAGEGDLGDLALGAARRVEGRLFFGEGTPIARAAISLAPRGQMDSSVTGHIGRIRRYSDDLGRYRFHDVCPGKYFLASMVDGYPTVAIEVVVPEDGELVVADLELPAMRPITVTVSGPGDEGVPGVWIMAQVQGLSPSSGRTDVHGQTVVHVPVGTEARIRAIPRGPDRHVYVQAPEQTVSPEDAELSFVLSAAQPVTGIVVDDKGAPIAGAMVEVDQVGRPAVSVTADGEGKIHVSTATSGSVTLRFHGFTYDREARPRERDSGLGGELKDVAPGTADVVLRAVQRSESGVGGTLLVRVEDPDGNPVAGANVIVSAEGRSWTRTILSGPDGVATMPDAADIPHTVMTLIRGDWYCSAPVTAHPGEGEIVLTYRRAAVIEGDVVRASGEAMTGLEAQAKRKGRLVCGNPVLADGSFRLIVPADETEGLTVVIVRTDNWKRIASEDWDGGSRVRIVIEE